MNHVPEVSFSKTLLPGWLWLLTTSKVNGVHICLGLIINDDRKYLISQITQLPSPKKTDHNTKWLNKWQKKINTGKSREHKASPSSSFPHTWAAVKQGYVSKYDALWLKALWPLTLDVDQKWTSLSNPEHQQNRMCCSLAHYQHFTETCIKIKNVDRRTNRQTIIQQRSIQNTKKKPCTISIMSTRWQSIPTNDKLGLAWFSCFLLITSAP